MIAVFGTDLGFIEGPVVCADGSIVLTSIDRGCLYRVTAGRTERLVVTGGGPNGLVEAEDGFCVAQNGGAFPALNEIKATAGVQHVDRAGRLSQVMTGPTAPNDLAFGPDGFLYVTDPTRRPERDDGRIWRCDVKTGKSDLLLTLGWYPNGIGFSLEDDHFYVADTGGRRIVRFPLANPTPEAAETVLTMECGMPDDGNIIIAAIGATETELGTVQIWSKAGRLIKTIEPKQSRFITNLAIASDGSLYVCDSGGGQLLRIDAGIKPLKLHPFRR
jgi:gluconolactonase